MTTYPTRMPGKYCRRCDVFVGHRAVGVVKQPAGQDAEWLAHHCWLCGTPDTMLCPEKVQYGDVTTDCGRRGETCPVHDAEGNPREKCR